MAEWPTHLMIADSVLEKIPGLKRHEFCVGNIAPDCNVENEDWTGYTPPREVTHWMTKERKTVADCGRFVQEYMKKKDIASKEEESFLLGYYSHLITDAEFQRYIRDEKRVKACWDRIKADPELSKKASGMPENWDSVKILINKWERLKDVVTIEAEYLEEHPDSGFMTEIIGLETFPNYIDYFPEGAIPRKVKIMGGRPQKQTSIYPYVGMSREEYSIFINRAIELVTDAIRRYQNENNTNA